jgi:phage shock protein C
MRRFEKIFRGGLYRSRKGILLGVCRGFAEYFDFSVFWMRVIVVVVFFFSGFWPVLVVYFVAALLMKPEPVIPIHGNDQEEFYDSYLHSRRWAVDRLKRRYDSLDRRLQRMEDVVTTKEFDWNRRLNT